jgi:hypothetical protein
MQYSNRMGEDLKCAHIIAIRVMYRYFKSRGLRSEHCKTYYAYFTVQCLNFHLGHLAFG